MVQAIPNPPPDATTTNGTPPPSPSHRIPVSPSHPIPISPSQFIDAYLDANLSLPALAKRFSLRARDLLALVNSPEIKPDLDALNELAEHRHNVIAAPLERDARLAIIQTLKAQVEAPDTHPVERRRACAILLRALNRPNHNGAPRDPSSSPSHPVSPSPSPDSPPIPKPRTRPSPNLTPDQVVSLALTALKDNDVPAPDTGLATLHAFLEESAYLGLADTEGAGSQPLEDFIADPPESLEPLLDQSSASGGRPPEIHPIEITGDLAQQRITVYLTTTAGTAPPPSPLYHFATPPLCHSATSHETYTFHLRRQSEGPRRHCWLIQNLTTDSDDQLLRSHLAARTPLDSS